jgi:hypothetical protein
MHRREEELQERLHTSMQLERMLYNYTQSSRGAVPEDNDKGSSNASPNYDSDNDDDLRASAAHQRPRTAPARSRSRPLTGTKRSAGPASRSGSQQRPQSGSRLYEERPHVATLMAMRNGETNPQGAVEVSAPGLRRMLEECTRRLKLPFAARTLYDITGAAIRSDIDLALLARGCVVFVSTGEPFRRPARAISLAKVRTLLAWETKHTKQREREKKRRIIYFF